MNIAEIVDKQPVSTHTYKAQVRVPRAGGFRTIALWVTIAEQSQIAARSMFEAQYGKGSSICQPAMAFESREAMIGEGGVGTPEEQRASRMKAIAKMQSDKARQMKAKAQADGVATQEKMKQAKEWLAQSGTPPSGQTLKPN